MSVEETCPFKELKSGEGVQNAVGSIGRQGTDHSGPSRKSNGKLLMDFN